ncbi:hypothetical protein QFZ70_001465 [Arthrobacter sp. V1I9]|uniref:hypothetical protein n=1 Tax=Arthrobacter sp. V1I9 TaxID=3042275 RepID=UPI00278F702F|nr:hypothetical protein [Arthrobacter sp. V1I9]MDQ0868992.1 hypothetical protein [Arthrobacter sp. V1I9]
MEIGSWADWVSGGATALALFLGLAGLLRERKKDRELSEKIAEDEHQRKKTELAAQASKVSSWFDQNSSSVMVRNASESVIYDVFVVLVNGRFQSDGTPLLVDEVGEMIRLVPPGQTASIPVPLPNMALSHYLVSSDLTFRDAQGLTWFRNNWGKLEKRDEDVFRHYDLEKPYKYADHSLQVF